MFGEHLQKFSCGQVLKLETFLQSHFTFIIIVKIFIVVIAIFIVEN
jgi:hypothetical protein